MIPTLMINMIEIISIFKMIRMNKKIRMIEKIRMIKNIRMIRLKIDHGNEDNHEDDLKERDNH